MGEQIFKWVNFLTVAAKHYRKAEHFLRGCLSAAEIALYRLQGAYSTDELTPNTNQPDQGSCNMHSWSDKGPWTGCCYTEDHENASCIWSKPEELTDYDSYGYEIAYYSSWAVDEHRDMAKAALEGWKGSPGHNRMILNKYCHAQRINR